MVRRSMEFLPANHRAPSGPVVMPLPPRGARLVTAPSVVIRISPAAPPPCEYQSAPSGPAAIPPTETSDPMVGYSVIAPAVVIRPILSANGSGNHSAPSEPV